MISPKYIYVYKKFLCIYCADRWYSKSVKSNFTSESVFTMKYFPAAGQKRIDARFETAETVNLASVAISFETSKNYQEIIFTGVSSPILRQIFASVAYIILSVLIIEKYLWNSLQDASTLVAYRNLFCLAFVGPVTAGDKTAIEQKIVSGWQSSGSQYASMEVNIRLQEMYLEIATRYFLFWQLAIQWNVYCVVNVMSVNIFLLSFPFFRKW